MGDRRGFYEIILSFFLVVIIVFAIIAFIFMNTSSSMLYGKVKETAVGPREASMVKDTLLACHGIDYLKEGMLDAQLTGAANCRAQQMLSGFRVTRLALNGCTTKEWSFAKAEAAQSVPYIIAVQGNDGKYCLARLDVLMGDAA